MAEEKKEDISDGGSGNEEEKEFKDLDKPKQVELDF